MNLLIRIFVEFFKTGLFAIGGGLATIPFLNNMGQTYGWFNEELLSTMIAVSESTPGPIGINMATYVGYHLNGLLGSATATVALVTPSVIIICVIANMMQKFQDSKLVKEIFTGLKPMVLGLIVYACIGIFKNALFNSFASLDIKWEAIVLLAVLLVIQQKYKKLHPVFLIVIAAFIGIIFKF